MTALDFILSPTKIVAPVGGSTVTPPAGDKPGGESFDQVMARTLSPSTTDKSTPTGPADGSSPVASQGKQNTSSVPVPQRPVHARSAAPEKAAAAAGETGDSAVQLSDRPSAPRTGSNAKNDFSKGRGDAATAASDQNEPPAVSGGLPESMAQMVAVLPAGVPPLISSAVEKKNSSDKEAIPATPSSSMATAATGLGASGASGGRRRAEPRSSSPGPTSNSKAFSAKTSENFISSLTPGGRQKNAVEVGGSVVGGEKNGGLQSAALPFNDFKTAELTATNMAGQKSAVEPMVPLAQRSVSLSEDSRATLVFPAPVQGGDTVSEETNAKDLPSAAPLAKDLPAGDLTTTQFFTADRTGLKWAPESAGHSSQYEASPATDSSGATTIPVSSDAGNTAVVTANAGDAQSAFAPVNDLSVGDLEMPVISAVDFSGLKSGVAGAVYLPSAAASPTTGSSRSTVTPMPVKAGDATAEKTNPGDFQTVSLPLKNLPGSDLNTSELSVNNFAGQKSTVEPMVPLAQRSVSLSEDSRATLGFPAPVQVGNTVSGGTNAKDLQSVAPLAKDGPADDLTTTEFSAADRTGLKLATESADDLPQYEASPATDSSGATTIPVPSDPGDAVAGETNASDFEFAAWPVNNLPASDFNAAEFSAAGGAGLKSDAEPMIDLPRREASLSTDSGATTVVPVTTKADDAVFEKTKASDLTLTEFSAADLTGLKLAAEPAIHLSSSGVSPATDSGVKTIISVPLKAGGTPVAKLSMPMENNEKLNKVAGLTGVTEKVLPDDADLTVSGNNLPVTDGSSARVSLHHESEAVILGLSTRGTESVTASVSDSIPVSSVVDLRARAIERTHDMIALQGLRLVDAKLDSLQVVIKPGAGMQLSLELRQHGGVIDAQAVLQRGDFGPLSQHWPELQQRLGQHGVHLAPLSNGENANTNFGSNGFQSPQHEFNNPDPLEASAFAEFALAGPAAQSPTPALAATVSHHGWETWA
jgi:hypothetical protein